MDSIQSPGATTGSTDRQGRSIVDRLKATTLARVIAVYGPSQVGNYSAGLAFNAFMAMFPMILGILAVIGLLVSNPGIQRQAQSTILSAFPNQSGSELSTVISRDLTHHAGLLGIVSILGLLWAGTNFFASLEFTLGRIFDLGQRGFLRQRVMGALMMLVLVVGLLLSVAANTVMNLVPLMAGVGPVVGFVVMAVLSLLLLRLVPVRSYRIAELWPGAVVAGVLIELITLIFPLYGKLAHGFDTYGQSLALFFLLATWLAFLSQFILIGALWNRVRLGLHFTATGLLAKADSGSSSAAGSGGHDAVAGRPAPARAVTITGTMPAAPPPALPAPPRREQIPHP